jgi:hypothetical protein
LYFDAGLRQGDYGGTGDYMHMEGDVYHLMPFKSTDSVKLSPQVYGSINTAKSYDLFMNKFIWGGAERNDVYFDEPNRRELATYRMDASFVANALTAEGKKDSAIKVLDKVMANITEHSYFYDLPAYYMVVAYYRAGALKQGKELATKITKNAVDDVNWAATLSDEPRAYMADDVKQQLQIIHSLSSYAYTSGDTVTAKNLYEQMQALIPKVKDLLNQRQPQQQGGGDEEE